ncbi:MAG: Flp family type IVb pilin [Aliivibrio sp.]|uniref:Flp family type IVb pilin n=1 Tax=Aliivibrio sp. TaxID=1872443 RepID=UPI001A5BA1CC|nr:Flp family type IVb pilin [Aliivibrio sp.]
MMTNLAIQAKLALMDFKNDQRGVTAIEYAIIGVAISAVVLAAFNSDLGTTLTTAMGRITAAITASGT